MKLKEGDPILIPVITFAFLMYWVTGPVVAWILGPQYLFSSWWWVVVQIIFLPLTLWWMVDKIRQIAEPGEVRWFRNDDLLKIPPKEKSA
jgi:hypothetical protein